MKYFLYILLFSFSFFAQDCPEGYVNDISGEDCIPELFFHNTSILQAFYYFINVSINSAPVDNDDWVAAFNEDVCIGARKWDITQCGNQICEVPVLGDSGDNSTDGYISNGEVPIFKIFDASDNVYYNAIPSENVPWQISGVSIIDLLEAQISECPESIEGDLNLDNITNILDIVLLVNCILSDNCNNCFDLNYDNEINIIDIVTLVNFILNF